MEQNEQAVTLQKVNWIFLNIQDLSIRPTEKNIQILGTSQKFLKEIYAECEWYIKEIDQLAQNVESLKAQLEAIDRPQDESKEFEEQVESKMNKEMNIGMEEPEEGGDK